MLSFGYAMLFGNCCVSLIGARLDPDSGLMQEGKGSLVQDLIEPLKADMIDQAVFQITRESLNISDFEQIPGRCILSDDLTKKLIGLFHSSIHNDKIDELVSTLYNAITNNGEFIIRY
jgi:CRISPR/Cas system-associated endonuclease Cas1